MICLFLKKVETIKKEMLFSGPEFGFGFIMGRLVTEKKLLRLAMNWFETKCMQLVTVSLHFHPVQYEMVMAS